MTSSDREHNFNVMVLRASRSLSAGTGMQLPGIRNLPLALRRELHSLGLRGINLSDAVILDVTFRLVIIILSCDSGDGWRTSFRIGTFLSENF